MRKTIVNIILVILICMLCLNVLQVKEHASTDFNVLFISNESAVNGDDISDMISDIGKSYNITVTNVKVNNNSLTKTLSEAKKYTDIIIQDTYQNLFNSNWELANSNINCYLGMPWKELTDAEKQTIKDKCQSIFGNSSINIIERVYTNLLAVKEAGIEVANTTGTLTRAGELTLACTYITEITKTPIAGLTSYDGISDASVKTIVDKVNGTISTLEPSINSITENTTNSINTTNTTNAVNKTTKTTAKTTTKTSIATGSLEANPMSINYLKFKSDREPRLSFVKTEAEYLYINFKDYDGIKCEHTGDAKNQPKVYTCDDATGKNKKEITDLYRCKKADYIDKQGLMYIYTLGIPSKYIGDKKTYFYVVGYDVHSNVIREYISATRKKDGTYSVDRAPRSCAVTTNADKTNIGFLAIDYTGISTIKARTIKDKDVDVLGQWNGTTQKNWSQVESVTENKKNMTSAITNANKVSTFFKNRTWKGKNPKVSGKNGVYKFVIEAKDAVGLSSVKTMAVNTTLIEFGYDYEPITSKKTTKKTTQKKQTTKKATTKSSEKEGYWEVKNGKYKYHYLNGTTKNWTVSEYIAWKKLKEQNVKAKDPNVKNESKLTNWKSFFTYLGVRHRYYVDNHKADNIAIKNGVSPYAVTVDIDRRHESVFKNNKGVWEPYKSAPVNIGRKWKKYPDSCYDPNTYTKNTLTPTGLFYISGYRHRQNGICWVGFGVKYTKGHVQHEYVSMNGSGWGDGHGWNREDYLHSGEIVTKGKQTSGGCVVSSPAHAKWIYENCGRGTPVLIW